MNNPIIGSRTLFALKKATTWGTAVACGANDGILYLSGASKRDATVQIDQSRGLGFSTDGTAGQIKNEPTFKFNLRYIGMDVAIAAFMGLAGAPTQQGTTTAYQNIYKFAPDTYGIFLTLLRNMINYIEEIPTAKVSGLTITGQVGASPLTLDVDVIGINKEVASLINTLATAANITIPSGGMANPVMFSHCVFRMNDQSGAALGSGDIIQPSKFTLTLKRKMQGEYGAFRTTTASPQDLIDEPTPSDFPELKLTLEFPKHTGTTYLSALGNDTRKKMDIVATGAPIAAPYNYQHMWQFPHLQMMTDNPSDAKGRITEPLEFLIHGATTAPAGMTGITDPLWWTVVNTRSTDPLA